jgi:hypothetical protein
MPDCRVCGRHPAVERTVPGTTVPVIECPNLGEPLIVVPPSSDAFAGPDVTERLTAAASVARAHPALSAEFAGALSTLLVDATTMVPTRHLHNVLRVADTILNTDHATPNTQPAGCPMCGEPDGRHRVTCPAWGQRPPRAAFPPDDDPGGYR